MNTNHMLYADFAHADYDAQGITIPFDEWTEDNYWVNAPVPENITYIERVFFMTDDEWGMPWQIAGTGPFYVRGQLSLTDGQWSIYLGDQDVDQFSRDFATEAEAKAVWAHMLDDATVTQESIDWVPDAETE